MGNSKEISTTLILTFLALGCLTCGQTEESGDLSQPYGVPQVTFSSVDAVVTNGSITFGFDVTAVTPKSDDWITIVRKGGSWLAVSDGDYDMTLGASAGALTLTLPLPAATAVDFDLVYYQSATEPYLEIARYQGITVPVSTAGVVLENEVDDGASLSGTRYQDFSVAEVVDSLIEVVVENFYDEEVALRTVGLVSEHLGKGDYDGMMSSAALARSLTGHLIDVSKDSHYRITFEPEKFDFLNTVGAGEVAEKPEVRARKAIANNFGFAKIEILPGNIGYLKLDEFNSEPKAIEKAYAAMAYLEDCEEIIIDLRENGGGYYPVEEALISYFFPAKPKVHINNFYYRDESLNEDNWTRDDLPGKRLLEQHAFILTAEPTYSAAEAVAYALKVRGRATIVGQTSSGGANSIEYFPLVQGFVAKVPVAKGVDSITGTSWDGVGVEVDVSCPAAEALDRAHILALERRLTDCEVWECKSIQYIHDVKRAMVFPAEISNEFKADIAGDYGNAKVAVVNESLSLQLAGSGERWRKLYPLTEDIFMVEEAKEERRVFRVAFRGPGGASTHLQLKFDDGRIIEFARKE